MSLHPIPPEKKAPASANRDAITLAIQFAGVDIRTTVDRSHPHDEPFQIIVTGPALPRKNFMRLHRAISHVGKLVSVLHGETLAVDLRRIPMASQLHISDGNRP